MKSLKALTEHLKALEFINDNFDAWVEKGQLEYSGSDVLAGLEPANLLMRIPYVAVFSWEAWGGSAYELFAVVLRWLVAQGYDFDDLGFPEFSADVLDDETADVQLTIRFIDEIYERDGALIDKPLPNEVDSISVCGGA